MNFLPLSKFHSTHFNMGCAYWRLSALTTGEAMRPQRGSHPFRAHSLGNTHFQYCLCVCVHAWLYVCALHTSWNWSYRWLWEAVWVLGFEPSTKAASALNHRSICPAHGTLFFLFLPGAMGITFHNDTAESAAILGHTQVRTPLCTGPLVAEPFISPLLFAVTPELTQRHIHLSFHMTFFVELPLLGGPFFWTVAITMSLTPATRSLSSHPLFPFTEIIYKTVLLRCQHSWS